MQCGDHDHDARVCGGYIVLSELIRSMTLGLGDVIEQGPRRGQIHI